MENFEMLAVYFLLLCFTRMSFALDMITPSQPLRDGYSETLSSEGGRFEAGFFNPANSKSRYVGIWYKNIVGTTVVWVANREKPLHDASAVLQIDGNKGILRILDSKRIETWSSSNVSKNAEKPIVKLLDSGNLVVTDEKNLSNILWQSFDYPGDTFLPGMKIRSNIRTGQYIGLTSWKSLEDPTPGEYSMHIDTKGLPQLVVTHENKIRYRAGSWDGLGFTGTPELRDVKYMKLHFELSEDEVFYEYEILNNSTLMRSRLTPEGYPLRFTWSSQKNGWDQLFPSQFDLCEGYALCGPNTNCSAAPDPQNCRCLTGYTRNTSGGCFRTTPLGCGRGDSFQKYKRMKLPDTSASWYKKTMSLQECEKLCLRNCTCTAYSNLNISNGGSGCLHWFNEIVDMRELAEGGQDFYLRVSIASDPVNNGLGKRKLEGIVIGCTIFVISIVILGLAIWIKKNKLMRPGKAIYWKDKSDKDNIDLPIFEFSSIFNATNLFSESNKLGQGGFGPVYQGILDDGQEIAVKRLSKTSAQGIDEFKNEVLLIAKLQHRNLVKLLGCSIEQEKLLIYEFMPNGSLDYFIFDSIQALLLDWAKRFHIIDGIARSLLYLHQDSRLRIIHRDLKTSNILLDNDMNPKISDFGMARIFGGDQAEANTNRVMGTYGYMPPEYVMHGSFSTKSDVFSFGVIVLEIISGKKNRGFCDPDHHLNLLGHAWKLWIEERPAVLMDVQLQNSVITSELLRCTQMGLLCVQQRPEDRPNMSTVVLMLNGEKLLPNPCQPGFYTEGDNLVPADSTTRSTEECSINEVSHSSLVAR